MHTGRLFQSRGAAAINDRSPMVTFVKRLGVLRRFPLFLTDSNASLSLFSSVNHETFLEIYFANINDIFPASNRLLTKITQNMWSETFKQTHNYQEKMAQVFHPRSINRALSRTHTQLILGSF